MKLRIVTILASVVVSALLLFGGWFLYRELSVKSPLEKLVEQYEGVNNVQLNIKPKDLELELDLVPGTDLGKLVRNIEDQGKKWIGNRELNIEIKDQSSPALDELWSNAMFPIAQAMENRQYTDIMTALEQMERENKNITATAEMDEKNVYVTISDGESSKFIILPRVPDRIGVWPNA